MMMMMMMMSPFGHKAVGDLSGVSEMYSHQPHSPIIEVFWHMRSYHIGFREYVGKSVMTFRSTTQLFNFT
jgi:hypothetical protein